MEPARSSSPLASRTRRSLNAMANLETGQWYFEDFRAGESFRTKTLTLTEYHLHAFVGLCGFFEDMFINERAACEVLGQRKLIPGYLTLSIAEGLCVMTGRLQHGMGLLGVDDVRFHAPVGCGDSVSVEVLITDVRASESLPNRGIVSTLHRVINQHAIDVLSFRKAMLVERRSVVRRPSTTEGLRD